MRPEPMPLMCYSVSEAASLLNVNRELVNQAIRKTLTDTYPPILPIAGRHGYGGKFAIRHRDLVEWAWKIDEPDQKHLPPQEETPMAKRNLPRLVLSIDEAAACLGVSPTTIRKALHETDPRRYPPPLSYAGRHGHGGKYAIRPSDLEKWVDSLGRFG